MLPLTMHRKLTRGVRLAVRARLMVFLEDEERNYARWKNVIAPKLKATRQVQVARKWKKRIQALRIVIWMLTPYEMRDMDEPGLFERY